MPMKRPVKYQITLKDLRCVRYQPGDVFVLQTDLLLSKEQVFELNKVFTKQIHKVFGKKAKSLIITSGLKMSLLRKEGEQT